MEEPYGGNHRDANNVARGVLRYLLANPRARDAREGIYNWWLEPLLRDLGVDAFDAALRELRDKEWLSVYTSRSGVETYGLNPDRKSEVQRYLAKESK